MDDDRSPLWHVWLVPGMTVQPWQAVVLSFGIEPTSVEREGGEPFGEDITVLDRFHSVKRVIASKRKPQWLTKANGNNSIVDLAGFAYWAKNTASWRIPSKLARFATMNKPHGSTDRRIAKLKARVSHLETQVKAEMAERRKLEARVVKLESFDSDLTELSKLSYLKTIGALLHLLLKKDVSGKAHYASQADVIRAIQRAYPKTRGLGKRTFEDRFSEAIGSLPSG